MLRIQLLKGLRYQYVENWDWMDPPVACFSHADDSSELTATIDELNAMIVDAKRLGITNSNLETAQKELRDAQDEFDRILPKPAYIPNFFW